MTGGEFAVLDVVLQIRRQLALRDLVAREMSGVGRDAGQFDAPIAHADVGIGALRQQIGLTPDMGRRIAVDRPVQVDLGAGRRGGGQSVDGTVELLDTDGEVRLDPLVGVVR